MVISRLKLFIWYGFLIWCSMGLDLTNGTIRNNLEAGVIEPAMSKVKIIQVLREYSIVFS